MQPQLEIMPKMTFIGKRIVMSYANNKTGELWRDFMPSRKQVTAIGTSLYSIEVYPSGFFKAFNPAREFEKWAAVEMGDASNIPVGMEQLVSPEGLYAVFIHYGPASTGSETYRNIFTEWLPFSAYAVNHRPHLAIMGDKYSPESADSKEEIWIPVIVR